MAAFDEAVGLGDGGGAGRRSGDGGGRYPFHCTQIADGTRTDRRSGAAGELFGVLAGPAGPLGGGGLEPLTGPADVGRAAGRPGRSLAGGPRPRDRSAGPLRLGRADLHEGHAQLAEAVGQLAARRRRAGRRARRPGRRGRRWPGGPGPAAGGWSDRCRAASSNRPKAWLATTTSAGVRASWSRSSSISAAISSSVGSSAGRPAPGRRRPAAAGRPAGGPGRLAGRRRLPADRSLAPGVQSVLIALPYVENRIREAGPSAPTRPPVHGSVRPGRSTAWAGVAFRRPPFSRRRARPRGVMPHSRCT